MNRKTKNILVIIFSVVVLLFLVYFIVCVVNRQCDGYSNMCASECARQGQDIYNPNLFSKTPASCCDGQDAHNVNGKMICPDANCACPGDDIYNPNYFSKTPITCCDGQSAYNSNGKMVCPSSGPQPPHPSYKKNATIVIRHADKEGNVRKQIDELNVLGFDIKGVYSDLSPLGIKQAELFPYSIKLLMDRYNLAKVTKAYTVSMGKENKKDKKGNANTLLTSSPYLKSAGFTKNTVDMYLENDIPTFKKPTNGSTFIAGNASTLYGPKPPNGNHPTCDHYTTRSVLGQLCKLYKVCPKPCISQMVRGQSIFIFTEDGLYTNCEHCTNGSVKCIVEK